MRVPFRFCTLVLKENLENTTQIFLALKLLFVGGNFKMNDCIYTSIQNTCGIKDKRTIKKQLSKLIELDWIWIDEYNKNLNIRSFSKILENNKIQDYYCFEFGYKELKMIRGFFGAVLFTFCSYKFWVSALKTKAKITIDCEQYSIFKRGNRRVIISDFTNKTISPLSLNKIKTPVAIEGVSKLFMLSKSKVNRLKIEASNYNLIKIFNTYNELEIPFNEYELAIKVKEIDYAIKYNRKLFLRKIDLITTRLKMFKTRKQQKSKL